MRPLRHCVWHGASLVCRGEHSTLAGRSFSAFPSGPSEGQLMPALSADLYGFHRGVRGAVEEPIDVWLAMLADAVPFYKDSLVMVPRRWTRERQKALWRRAQQHLPGAHLGTLPDRAEAPATPTEMAVRTSPLEPTAAVPRALATSPTTAAMMAPTVAPRAGALERTADHSLDLLVLASNLFSEEMFFQAPWYISMAHRTLRPHGVLGMFGSSPRVAVVAPAWAGDDVAEYLAQQRDDARDAVSQLRARLPPLADTAHELAQHDGGDEHRLLSRARRLLNRLEQALEIEQSESEGYRDVYLPFRGVQRRWFTSEYAMSPAQLVALLRAMPLYQLLRDPTLTEWLHTPGTQWTTSASVAGRPDSDFVADAGETRHVQALHAASPGSAETVHAHVRRRRQSVDGLEMLEAYLAARLGEKAPRHADAHHTPPTAHPSSVPLLRVQVQFFVVTCSGRSMNASDAFGRFIPPSSAVSPPHIHNST